MILLLAHRCVGQGAQGRRGRERKKVPKVKKKALESIERPSMFDVEIDLSPALLFSRSLTPSAAASAARVAAPAPVAALASVQGTRPESGEAQGGHSIVEGERVFFFFFLSFNLF